MEDLKNTSLFKPSFFLTFYGLVPILLVMLPVLYILQTFVKVILD